MKTFTTLTIAALALGAADAKVQGRPFHDAKPLSQDVAAQEDPHNLFPHIIGGTEIRPPKKFGFLAALSRVGYSAYDGQFCGGAVVGPRTILTAAHCCEGFKADEVEILVGWHDLENENDGVKMRVTDIEEHKRYNSRTMAYDFCKMTLAADVPAGTQIAKVDDGTLNLAGRTVVVAGWGNTSPTGSAFATKAMEVGVPYVSNEVCNARTSYNGEISDDMMCAGFAAGGKDACQGDSGGPLFFDGGGSEQVLVGVVSWGYGCAQPNMYGVYGRNSVVTSWINKQDVNGVGPANSTTVE